MLKSTSKIATFAIAGVLITGGAALQVHATNVYDSTAVAGITLSVNDYVASIEDQTPAVVETSASGEATEAKESSKNADFVAAKVEDSVNIRKKGTTNSKVVGQMYKGDVGKLVKKGKTWSKIKSGNAEGWVKNDFLLTGDKAKEYADKICPKVLTVKTTTLNVRAKKSENSDIVTQIPGENKYEVIKEYDKWVKIAIDDTKGYVSKDYVKIKTEYGSALTMKEIDDILAAQAAAEAAAAAQAAAVPQTTTVTQTYTSTSSQNVSTIKPSASSTYSNGNSGSSFSNSGSSSSSTSSSSSGSAIANYALQFVGNKYVYGGTSLTNGTDCSGFTQSVYKHFGYNINRTAASQTANGKSVSTSNLQPGDLVFYGGSGSINHVAMYIGNGQVVHASNAKTGIKTSSYNYRTPTKAVRITK